MRVLISGVCGFVGAKIALQLVEAGCTVVGFDNLARQGSWVNFETLRHQGIDLRHADVRIKSDLDQLPPVDWIIDAAATPSVLAGVGNGTSSQQLVDTNLVGTVHLLELCKQHQAGFVLLSTSRVYSIQQLQRIPLKAGELSFAVDSSKPMPHGVSLAGINEEFSTEAPISLYGATKLASEVLAKEYSQAFGFPLRINRCGVMAGGGQFARADQGIFAFWLHRWQSKRPLRYIGFEGLGRQVRDCLHPLDLASLLLKQMQSSGNEQPVTLNVSGGRESATSLAQLSAWCESRWGPQEVGSHLDDRAFDVPWVVLDSSTAEEHWGWSPEMGVEQILADIADFAEQHPNWLSITE